MIEPLFFGPREAPRFGVYHPPEGRARDHGVLLCAPGPHESMRSHWAFRRLAALLGAAGLPVFRFDYFGTGDSAGETGEGGLACWAADAALALTELREISGVRRTSIVGFRLGAAVAAAAAVRVQDLVLWEPVATGRDYVAELLAAHEALQGRLVHRIPDRGGLLGLPFTPAGRSELEGVDLAGRLACSARRVTIVVSEDRPEWRALRGRLEAGSPPAAVDLEVVPEDADGGRADGVLLSTRVLRAIAERLGKAA